ncbi:MAG: biopolymer transporter ExbD [Bacteroidota bacterium]
MAEIIENDSGSGKEGGRRKPKKMGANIDMTPMVDLMCLLITFFMLTTAFSKPKVMDITMPEKTEKPDDGQKVDARRTYSILLTQDRVYWYWHFDFPAGSPEGTLPTVDKWHKTDFSKDGLRKVLLKINKSTIEEILTLKEKVKKGELVMPDDSLNSKIKAIKKKYSVAKKSPTILIKAADDAKYKSIVAVIDEMAITNISGYAIVDMTKEEKEMLKNAPK